MHFQSPRTPHEGRRDQAGWREGAEGIPDLGLEEEGDAGAGRSGGSGGARSGSRTRLTSPPSPRGGDQYSNAKITYLSIGGSIISFHQNFFM
jgi:hypothetical protein